MPISEGFRLGVFSKKWVFIFFDIMLRFGSLIDPVSIPSLSDLGKGPKMAKNCQKIASNPDLRSTVAGIKKCLLEKLTEKQIYTVLCTGVQWGTLKQLFDPRSKVATF